jgi:hypothetical protein
MPVAVEEDVRRTISPDREAKAVRAFHAAWRDVQVDQSKYNIWARTRANMMFERLTVRLQEEFASDSSVRFFFADETIKITFDNLILGRCKKANDRRLGQNVPTQAVMTFCEADDELPGFSGLQKVEILYVVNRVGTAIEQIFVQARDGDMRLWAYPMNDIAEGGAVVAPLPLQPPPPPPPGDASDLVQPRTRPAEQKEDTNDSEK